MKQKVSVVIPCYNHGKYLKEALDSLNRCNPDLFETIIVNDGSTDEETNNYLRVLQKEGYKIIWQENQGLGAARNAGIKHASGDYILPHDADNKIFPAYIEKSIAVLDQHKDVAVVYGNCRYFGEQQRELAPGPFNLQRMMLGNYIDACAVIRKSVLEEVGYYDSMKIQGLEDWDLWLRIAFKGYRFYYINELLFEYRVISGSMIRSLNKDIARQNEIEKYLSEKFKEQLSYEDINNYFIYKIKKKPFLFLKKLILKKYFPSYYNKLVRTNKMYRGWLYE